MKITNHEDIQGIDKYFGFRINNDKQVKLTVWIYSFEVRKYIAGSNQI